MSQHNEADDLVATMTDGYKPGEKKDLSELQKLDANDESLNKWKASLGLNQAESKYNVSILSSSLLELRISNSTPSSRAEMSSHMVMFPDDPRTVIVKSLVLDAGGHKIEMDVSSSEKIAELKDRVIVIKEGAEYFFKVEFYVQREVVSGLKFLQQVKRLGLPVDKTEGMCGSYGPKNELQEK
ncbi:rho GDP dissociation inhibitor, partial [Coemansia sp. RSA 2603]